MLRLQEREGRRERESCKVLITTCRYGCNEISCSNETPAGCNVALKPSGGEPQDQRGSCGLLPAVEPFYRKLNSCCSTYDVHFLFLDFLVHLYDSHQRETCNIKNGLRSDSAIVLGGTLLAGIETTRTFVLNYSGAVGVVDTLIQRGATAEGEKWRTRQTVGSRAAAATAITWSLNERLRIADNVDKGCARRVSTIQYRNPPPTQETLGGEARLYVHYHVSSATQSAGRLFGLFAKYSMDVIQPYEISSRKLFGAFPRDFPHQPPPQPPRGFSAVAMNPLFLLTTTKGEPYGLPIGHGFTRDAKSDQKETLKYTSNYERINKSNS
ncbi:hypothetical protein G5I_13746 [Acromyrmex echinatior]|uniref:Uncharacterized protein n=1 Tax=Acromyrmex echinatior TaxID=103372 RepID=F4X5V5_ACREC|nr:hypothetical protein G5I_13746 [Acromyrmex echinatior]